jgi:predicted solute-binding protein
VRLAVWSVLPARALGYALAESAGLVSEVVELDPHQARAALIRGDVDLALVPTLSVLRQPDGLELVPGAGIAAESWPYSRLLVRSALTEISTVALDPRDQQEAVLAQITLAEHYGKKPSFRPVEPEGSLERRIGNADALLVTGDDASEATLDGATPMDVTLEWLELTLRPMVHGLLAAPDGTLEPQQAIALRDALREAEAQLAATAAEQSETAGLPPRDWQVTLDGYAQDGLEAFIQHLYYRGALDDFPTLPFIDLGSESETAGESEDTDEA